MGGRPAWRGFRFAVRGDWPGSVEQDFRIPLSFGFRHVYGENGGPGAMFHALRNYQLIHRLHDIEQFMPETCASHFTNLEAEFCCDSGSQKIKAIGLLSWLS